MNKLLNWYFSRPGRWRDALLLVLVVPLFTVIFTVLGAVAPYRFGQFLGAIKDLAEGESSL